MTNLQAIDLLKGLEQSLDDYCELNDEGKTAFGMAITALELFGNSEQLTSAQPEVIRCKDCIYYDPPHVENNGVRYEYDEMPADAFDALGTGLVNAEYGINIGGRCCVDYYCKNYSDNSDSY